jgi:hypothetical protein
VKARHPCTLLLSAVAVMAWLATVAQSQQITSTPGSPGATTTIDGKQLPPEPPKFGGVIEEDAKDSTPYWPPSVARPMIKSEAVNVDLHLAWPTVSSNPARKAVLSIFN